jgi:hypothetical protein
MNTHVHATATPPSTHDTTRIDDTRIGRGAPADHPGPAERMAAHTPCRAGAGGTQPSRALARAARRRRPADRGGGAVLHPRPRPGDGIRARAERAGRRAAGRPADRDARVLREAPHHRGLEGLHQRPAPGRQFCHQRRAGAGAQALAGRAGSRSAGGHRIPGPAEPAVHQRPGELGRHRRAHHREPEPPPAGQRLELPRGLQERHRRRREGGLRCHPGRAGEPRLHGHDQDGPGGDLRDPRQRRLPRHPAWRQGAQLLARRRGTLPVRC